MGALIRLRRPHDDVHHLSGPGRGSCWRPPEPRVVGALNWSPTPTLVSKGVCVIKEIRGNKVLCVLVQGGFGSRLEANDGMVVPHRSYSCGGDHLNRELHSGGRVYAWGRPKLERSGRI